MRAVAVVACMIAGTAWADAPKVMSASKVIAAFVPGMTEGDARRRAQELACDASDQGDAITCHEDVEPAFASWTLWFASGKLDRVEYRMSFDLDQPDKIVRAATRQLERRASELETAASDSGGAKRRVPVRKPVSYGEDPHARCLRWSPSKKRASQLQLVKMDEGGQSAKRLLAFEIVAPTGELTSFGIFDDAR